MNGEVKKRTKESLKKYFRRFLLRFRCMLLILLSITVFSLFEYSRSMIPLRTAKAPDTCNKTGEKRRKRYTEKIYI